MAAWGRSSGIGDASATPSVTRQGETRGGTDRIEGNRAWWGLWLPWSKQAAIAQLQPKGVTCKHLPRIIKSSPFFQRSQKCDSEMKSIFKTWQRRNRMHPPARSSLGPSMLDRWYHSEWQSNVQAWPLNASESTRWRWTSNYSCGLWRRKPKHSRNSWIFNSCVLKWAQWKLTPASTLPWLCKHCPRADEGAGELRWGKGALL